MRDSASFPISVSDLAALYGGGFVFFQRNDRTPFGGHFESAGLQLLRGPLSNKGCVEILGPRYIRPKISH